MSEEGRSVYLSITIIFMSLSFIDIMHLFRPIIVVGNDYTVELQ